MHNGDIWSIIYGFGYPRFLAMKENILYIFFWGPLGDVTSIPSFTSGAAKIKPRKGSELWVDSNNMQEPTFISDPPWATYSFFFVDLCFFHELLLPAEPKARPT